MFDAVQLRSFLMLCQERHFGRAAKRLFVTQPGLSRRIQQLEEAVGTPLLRRERSGVVPTPAGAAFLAEAEALLKQMAHAREAAQAAAGALIGRVSVGFDGAASYTLIPHLVRRAVQRLPGVAIDFVEHSSLEQLRQIAFRRLDLGLVRPLPHDPGIETMRVLAERLALAMPSDHRLAARRRPSLADLEGEPLVAYSEAGLYLRQLIDGMLDGAGVAPVVVQQMARTHSILALVSTGIGLAIVPAGSSAAAFDNIVFRPLPRSPLAEWHAAWASDAANPLVAPLRALMRDLQS